MDIYFFTDTQKREILGDKDLQKELNLSKEFIADLKVHLALNESLPQIKNFIDLNNAQIVRQAISELDEAMDLYFDGDSMQDLIVNLRDVDYDLYLTIGKFQKQMLCKK